MEKALIYRAVSNTKTQFALQTTLGCLLLVLCSLIKIPFYPVSFTLHTLAISLLGLTQSPKQAFASALCYLACGTLGLPVFSGVANPLWIMGKAAGYYVAFPFAAYLISSLRQKMPQIGALLCGHTLILGLGSLWLIPFIGLKAAFINGFLLFIPGDLCKSFAAISFVRWKNS